MQLLFDYDRVCEDFVKLFGMCFVYTCFINIINYLYANYSETIRKVISKLLIYYR